MTAPRLSIVRHPADPIARAPSVSWAAERLQTVCARRGGSARLIEREEPDGEGATVQLVGRRDAPWVRERSANPDASVLEGPESLALIPVGSPDAAALLACGADARGLTYALLELADRVEHAEDPGAALRIDAPIVERPANRVRSVARLFCSEVEDKAWFHDEGFWHRYLSMLATQRFNRFSLTLGLGYNYHRGVTDAYLYFAYPFLLPVPGYDVRVPQLPDEERERNLAMLRFISEQTTARGMDFQLGLWTHAYEWIDSPEAHHTIEGLTPETHGAYCRDAVRTLLEVCPAIGGLTFRIHGESGVPEGSFGFWREVFEGVAGCGRPVGLDLHAKGLDERTLGIALDTGLPVTVSPKFWAEHMGLPYHQASIRERERVPREDPGHLSEWHRYMRVSEGSRPFTRYGYGDLLREDRTYDVVFRLWAGTQRLLLWGDPAFAAAYGRAAGIAGAGGLEWCEPLTFKGREGSGVEGSRTGYADPALVPWDDWEKYEYTYRLFGRLSYDPDTDPDTWRRYLRTRFGSAASHAEIALASASRILPLVTTAHHPSASNNYYWPEIYTDMPIVWREGRPQEHPYLDTPSPRRFGTVSSLDPERFSSVEGFVRERLSGERSGRVSPLEVAGWLQDLSDGAARSLDGMSVGDGDGPDVRRLVADVAILEAMGRFFSGKIRAAVLFEFSLQTGSPVPLREAIGVYRAARAAWAEAADRATGVYIGDLTFGPEPRLRGTWADRTPAIDRDIEEMEKLAAAPSSPSGMPETEVRRILAEASAGSPTVAVSHTPPPAFRAGEELRIELEPGEAGPETLAAVWLRYRPMDQSQPYACVEMTREAGCFTATIPAGSTGSACPIQYFFVLRDPRGVTWSHPGLGADLTTQPYVVVPGERRDA